MTPNDKELLAVTKRLAGEAGAARPVALERLPGGRNNRAYKLIMREGPPLFLKSYFSHPNDRRDRLAAEWAFLAHAREMGLRDVPEPVAADPVSNIGLYSFIEGRCALPADVTPARIDAFADFVRALNKPAGGMASLPPASEACFSLAQHVNTIERRVMRLGTIDPATPLSDRAKRFVRTKLVPAWEEAKSGIGRAIREASEWDACLSESEVIASPSDFGFHNVILGSNGRMVFTDFEYAGQDDPAKLVCDFFCQPEIPVPVKHFARFAGHISERSGAGFHERARLLLDSYRIKWTCIILNEFQPAGAAQRDFAVKESRARRCEAQLVKAEAKLEEIEVA